MPRGVGRERWGEIRAGEVARLGAERRKLGIGFGRGIVVLVGLADGGDWTPDLLVVFRIPDGEGGIGHADIDERENVCKLEHAVLAQR